MLSILLYTYLQSEKHRYWKAVIQLLDKSAFILKCIVLFLKGSLGQPQNWLLITAFLWWAQLKDMSRNGYFQSLVWSTWHAERWLWIGSAICSDVNTVCISHTHPINPFLMSLSQSWGKHITLKEDLQEFQRGNVQTESMLFCFSW